MIASSRVAPGASSIMFDGCGVENVRVRGDVKLTLSRRRVVFFRTIGLTYLLSGSQSPSHVTLFGHSNSRRDLKIQSSWTIPTTFQTNLPVLTVLMVWPIRLLCILPDSVCPRTADISQRIQDISGGVKVENKCVLVFCQNLECFELVTHSFFTLKRTSLC